MILMFKPNETDMQFISFLGESILYLTLPFICLELA